MLTTQLALTIETRVTNGRITSYPRIRSAMEAYNEKKDRQQKLNLLLRLDQVSRHASYVVWGMDAGIKPGRITLLATKQFVLRTQHCCVIAIPVHSNWQISKNHHNNKFTEIDY